MTGPPRPPRRRRSRDKCVCAPRTGGAVRRQDPEAYTAPLGGAAELAYRISTLLITPVNANGAV